MNSLEQKAWEKWSKSVFQHYHRDPVDIFKAGYRAGLKQANPLGKLEKAILKEAIEYWRGPSDEQYIHLLASVSKFKDSERKLQAARKKVKP